MSAAIDTSRAPLRAPFPWFGGKSRAAPIVWAALGDVANYVEPFAGSLAVLLNRPTPARIETVNDADCYLANFWHAVRAAPGDVARAADWPVNEADLHARHQWLVGQAGFRVSMTADPEFYDAKVAGWWVWGLGQWIGDGWCAGAHRKLPNVDARGGKGVHSARAAGVEGWFVRLGARLRNTRVACGDWARVLTPSVLRASGATGIVLVLDPPYTDGEMAYSAGGGGISALVREWALEHGDNRDLRIVLCGYEGEHAMPEAWRCVAWSAKGGYAIHGNANRHRERLWLSPGCLDVVPAQGSLFGARDGVSGAP